MLSTNYKSGGLCQLSGTFSYFFVSANDNKVKFFINFSRALIDLNMWVSRQVGHFTNPFVS